MSTIQNRIVESDEAGMRLDRWFKLHFPGLAFGQLQKLLRSGQIRLDIPTGATPTGREKD